MTDHSALYSCKAAHFNNNKKNLCWDLLPLLQDEKLCIGCRGESFKNKAKPIKTVLCKLLISSVVTSQQHLKPAEVELEVESPTVRCLWNLFENVTLNTPKKGWGSLFLHVVNASCRYLQIYIGISAINNSTQASTCSEKCFGIRCTINSCR